jgi:hypothetical protein
VPADHPSDQAFVAQVVQATGLAVTLTRGVDQAQPARRAGGQEALLQRHRQVLRKADADEAAGGQHVAVGQQLHRFRRGHHLAAVSRPQSGHALMRL